MDTQNRLHIITGHYGSGKTEFAVNLALAFAREGRRPILADLDIVNPYFCSRERKTALEDRGVRVVLSSGATSPRRGTWTRRSARSTGADGRRWRCSATGT
jgi:Mrp family chromosome partitioning ATPase